jgi:hypothetical protein
MDDGQLLGYSSHGATSTATVAGSSSQVWSGPVTPVAPSPAYPAMYALPHRPENAPYSADTGSAPFQTHCGVFSTSQSTAESMAGVLPQIDSSIGPNRVLTRRQARAAQAQAAAGQQNANRVASAASLTGAIGEGMSPVSLVLLSSSGWQSDTNHKQAVFSTPPSMSPPAASRPQTPNGSYAPQFSPSAADVAHHTTPDMVPNVFGSHGSPLYPSTPLSASSVNYSPYAFFRHSRSGSHVTSAPRSASPALSVVSAITTISSAPSALTSGGRLSPSLSRERHRKGRLTNKDRRDICLYHSKTPAARQEDIAAMWHVERSTISKILKAKAKWLATPLEDDLKVARHK